MDSWQQLELMDESAEDCCCDLSLSAPYYLTSVADCSAPCDYSWDLSVTANVTLFDCSCDLSFLLGSRLSSLSGFETERNFAAYKCSRNAAGMQ